MKYLSHYTEKAISALLKDTGAFFAFSNQQFDEQKVEGIKYVSMGAGLICPKERAPELKKGLEDTRKLGIQKDIEENGIDNIISRELYNYEAMYTGDIDMVVEVLKAYNISEEDVIRVYHEELKKQ